MKTALSYRAANSKGACTYSFSRRGARLDLDARKWSLYAGELGDGGSGGLFAPFDHFSGRARLSRALNIAVANVSLEADRPLAAAATESSRRLLAL